MQIKCEITLTLGFKNKLQQGELSYNTYERHTHWGKSLAAENTLCMTLPAKLNEQTQQLRGASQGSQGFIALGNHSPDGTINSHRLHSE